jgi:hypothetical protein
VTRLADNNILVIGIDNCAKVWITSEGLNLPNSGGGISGCDASINADGNNFLCSASDGIKRPNALAIVPICPIGRTRDERVMGSNDKSSGTANPDARTTECSGTNCRRSWRLPAAIC